MSNFLQKYPKTWIHFSQISKICEYLKIVKMGVHLEKNLKMGAFFCQNNP